MLPLGVQSLYVMSPVTLSFVAVRVNVTVWVTGLAACLSVPAYVYVIVRVTVFVNVNLSGLLSGVSVVVPWTKTTWYGV